MSERSDEVQGRAKEAFGAITGNEDLKQEGKSDQMSAKAKRIINDVAGKLSEGVDTLREKMNKRR
jgi:uncharacterized protein YjbJ (UPF0337 family)